MYKRTFWRPPVHLKAISCTNLIFLPAFSSRGTEIHDDTERPVHGRARFACFSVPSVVTLTRTGPICCVYRPDRAVQRLQTAAKANAERRQRQRRTQWRRRRRREPPQAEAGFPARPGIPPRAEDQRPEPLTSAVAAKSPPAGTVKSPPVRTGHDVGAHCYRISRPRQMDGKHEKPAKTRFPSLFLGREAR